MYHVQHAIPVEKWGVIKNVQINAAGSRADVFLFISQKKKNYIDFDL